MGNTEGDFGPFQEKMKAEGLSEAAIDAFRHNYEQLVAGVTGLVRPPRLLAAPQYGVIAWLSPPKPLRTRFFQILSQW